MKIEDIIGFGETIGPRWHRVDGPTFVNDHSGSVEVGLLPFSYYIDDDHFSEKEFKAWHEILIKNHQ